ncbi:MAG: pyruvate kinase [Tissierellia bacterium]|nr:pyruvate kinase [Tissierellia bacterium]
MKKTKIVATIGPASDSEEVLRALVEEGMNVCRLNFSHGNHEEHKRRMDTIKRLREDLNIPLAIMLDTKGPEIRIGRFKDGPIRIEQGQEFTLTTEDILGDEKQVSVTYAHIDEVEPGSRVLIDDGLVEFMVKSVEKGKIHMEAINSGELSDRKGVNIPDVKIKLPSLTERDIEDIEFGIAQEIDYIAASFIRSQDDVLAIRQILEKNGNPNIGIISKIENREGVDNLEDILEVSDGLMVARGDLGVEIPPQEIPLVQKNMIRKCVLAGKVVITATQMLDSMTRNPRPTRAEVTDVANAILDGSSCIMLSGETAAGKYPVGAVRMMRQIAINTEDSPEYQNMLRSFPDHHSMSVTNALAQATWQIAKDLNAAAILTATKSGATSRAISKFRPAQTIVALTSEKHVYQQLSMEWGVYPIMVSRSTQFEVLFEEGIEKAKDSFIKEGDLIVLTAGVPVGKSGSTNLLKVEVISKRLAKGMGIGEGTITGRAVVANSPEELRKEFHDGDIIVTIGMHRDMVGFAERSGGIITEEGGLTSSGAIIGLNLKKPTIVGAADATKEIKSGDMITMDLKTGQVVKGVLENI